MLSGVARAWDRMQEEIRELKEVNEELRKEIEELKKEEEPSEHHNYQMGNYSEWKRRMWT